jgi:hypothetical protein
MINLKQLGGKIMKLFEIGKIKNYFDFNHLNKINSNYFKHLVIALYLVLLLFSAAIIGLIHAFIPFIFPFTPYKISKKVVKYTESYFLDNK